MLSARYTFKLPPLEIDWLSKLSNQDTTFYDITGRVVQSKQYCHNFEVLSPAPMDTNLVVERIYAFSGKILSEKYFLKSNLYFNEKDSNEHTIETKVLTQKDINAITRKIEGSYREWYDNGQLAKDFTVKMGKKNGELIFYWENGNLRRNEIYNNGELVSGKCYNKTGKIVPYFNLDIPAVFPGGHKELEKYFRDNLQYPKTALQNNIQGLVIVSFVLDSSGYIKQCWISKSVHTDLNAEAIRLVRKMPRWLVEIKDGEAVTSVKKVEINFSLN